jgi:hypothetical protein
MTLAIEPELLMLDDPATGLDPAARGSLLEAMIYFTRSREHTIFFSTHLLDDVERVADHVAVLDWTRCGDGRPGGGRARETCRRYSKLAGRSGSGVAIEGNLVGTDASGRVALGNAGAGISLGTNGATIGGKAPGGRQHHLGQPSGRHLWQRRPDCLSGPLHLCPPCFRKLCWNRQLDLLPYLERIRGFFGDWSFSADAQRVDQMIRLLVKKPWKKGHGSSSRERGES